MTFPRTIRLEGRNLPAMKPLLTLVGLCVLVACKAPAQQVVVVSNESQQTVYLRVDGPEAREDFEVGSGDRRDLVTSGASVNLLVTFDAGCSELLIVDFRREDRPFAAGGLVVVDRGDTADFEPGPQEPVGLSAAPSVTCANVPTPELLP